MTDINIFDSIQKGKFFAFSKIGDSIQGTLVDIYTAVDSYQNQQKVYVLKDKEGILHNVGIKLTNKILLEKLADVKLGFILGLRYEEDRPSKINPGAMAKIIRSYYNKDIVDKEWLANRGEIQSATATPAPTPIPTASVSGTITPETKTVKALEAIRNLATTQGLVSDKMTNEQKDKVISTFAKLPLTDENATAIIIALTGYKAEELPF